MVLFYSGFRYTCANGLSNVKSHPKERANKNSRFLALFLFLDLSLSFNKKHLIMKSLMVLYHLLFGFVVAISGAGHVLFTCKHISEM
mgnify:CR=1 FL=1